MIDYAPVVLLTAYNGSGGSLLILDSYRGGERLRDEYLGNLFDSIDVVFLSNHIVW